MRSKSEIKSDLLKKLLTNPEWQKLQNALIGKELISFGVEVIAAAESVANSVAESFDYRLANAGALISASHTLEIPVSFVRPSYIKVHLNTGVSAVRLYKPFSIVYNTGGLTFYNITFARSDEDVILYQGIAKFMKSPDSPAFKEFDIVTSEPWDVTRIPTDEDITISGHNIGICMPESVYVFRDGFVLSRFTHLRHGDEVKSFKIFTLFDKNQLILDGDGVWGSKDYRGDSYYICWLAPTNSPFALDGSLSADGYPVDFSVVSASQGTEDVDYARESFRKFYLNTYVVASLEQIKSFVNYYPDVLDCIIEAKNNSVVIYVKPTDPADTGDFGGICADLDARSVIGYSYQILVGEGLKFSLVLHGDVDEALKTEVERILKEELQYAKLPFDYKISAAKLFSIIQEKLGVVLTIKIQSRDEEVYDKSILKFMPLRGSLVLKEGNVEVGFDANGILYGRYGEELQKEITFNVPAAGKFFKVGDGFVEFNRGKRIIFPKLTIDRAFISEFGEDFTYSWNDLKWLNFKSQIIFYVKVGTAYYSIVCDYETFTRTALQTNLAVKYSKKFYPQNNSGVIYPFYSNGRFYALEYEGYPSCVVNLLYYDEKETINFSMQIGEFAEFVSDRQIYAIYESAGTLYVMVSGNQFFTVKNFASNNYAVVLSYIQNPEIVDPIIAAGLFDKGYFCMVTQDASGQRKLWKFDNITLINRNVQMQGLTELSVTLPTSDIHQIGINTEFIYILDDTNIMTVYEDQVYNEQRKANAQALANAGSINYETGLIVFNSNARINRITYSTDGQVMRAQNYLVLDEDNPFLWI